MTEQKGGYDPLTDNSVFEPRGRVVETREVKNPGLPRVFGQPPTVETKRVKSIKASELPLQEAKRLAAEINKKKPIIRRLIDSLRGLSAKVEKDY